MDELLQTNVFFFITSAAVIVLAVFWAVILYYVIRIIRDVKEITELVRSESVQVAEDIGELRDAVKKEGFKLWHILSFVVGRKSRRGKRKEPESAV